MADGVAAQYTECDLSGCGCLQYQSMHSFECHEQGFKYKVVYHQKTGKYQEILKVCESFQHLLHPSSMCPRRRGFQLTPVQMEKTFQRQALEKFSIYNHASDVSHYKQDRAFMVQEFHSQQQYVHRNDIESKYLFYTDPTYRHPQFGTTSVSPLTYLPTAKTYIHSKIMTLVT